MPRHETDLSRKYIEKPLIKAFGKRLRIKKIHSGPFSGKGFVDYFMCFEGIHIELEVKLWDNRKMTPHQAKALKKCHQAGGLAMVMIIEKNLSITLFRYPIGQSPVRQAGVQIVEIFPALSVRPMSEMPISV